MKNNQSDADPKNAIRPGFKVAWYVVIAILGAYQIAGFLRSSRDGVPLFHSTSEMILVMALVAVLIAGVIYKSRRG